MIRYPGSKAKITRQILSHFPHEFMAPLWQQRRLEYREPFFGGGAIGFAVLKQLPNRAHIWINDKDYGIACLWKSVYEDPSALVEEVQRFRPSVDAFFRFKEEDGRSDGDPVRVGFQKFALHQIGWSGLGYMAGGPLGGVKQRSEYNVDCRWNAVRHVKKIREIHDALRRFASVKITSGDFAPLIENAPSHAFIYADPPYYEKGPALYKHSMSDDDHRRLASLLRACRAPWVLSYDDHPFVRDLFRWAEVRGVALTYTVARAGGEHRRKNSEVVITPHADTLRVAANT